MTDGIGKAIRDNATGPAKVTADGVTVEQQKLTEQIAADKHEGAKKAFRSRTIGLRIARIVPPGAQGGY